MREQAHADGTQALGPAEDRTEVLGAAADATRPRPGATAVLPAAAPAD